MSGVKTESVEVLRGQGSRYLDFVDHVCRCGQTTRVPLRDVTGDGVWVPMTRVEFRADFSDEADLRGIGHNNDGVSYMVGPCPSAGVHRMSACAQCFRPWSIDDVIGYTLLLRTPLRPGLERRPGDPDRWLARLDLPQPRH